jgi:hypothetical protein
VVADRLSRRWYLGYDLTEPLPDHSSLTRIRERYGLKVFRRFFEVVVEQCLVARCHAAAKCAANTCIGGTCGSPQVGPGPLVRARQRISSGGLVSPTRREILLLAVIWENVARA